MATMLKARKSPENRTPLSEAAVRLQMSRERLLRRIQSGVVPGGQEDGLWYVETSALEALAGAAA